MGSKVYSRVLSPTMLCTDRHPHFWVEASLKKYSVITPFIFWAIDFVQKRLESIYRHKYKVLALFSKRRNPITKRRRWCLMRCWSVRWIMRREKEECSLEFHYSAPQGQIIPFLTRAWSQQFFSCFAKTI